MLAALVVSSVFAFGAPVSVLPPTAHRPLFQVRYATVASPVVGELFKATKGLWRHSPSSYAYQWERCKSGCTTISGETTNSYTVATADEGYKLRVAVTATNSFGSAEAHSAETGEVPSSSECSGTCIFIAPAGAGAGEGTSCTDAHSEAWLNESKNWHAPKESGKLGPGVTAALCSGSYSEVLETKGNGESGEPAVVKWLSGAKVAEKHCPEGGCVVLKGSSKYVTLNGGTNGTIEGTDNGTGKEEVLKSTAIQTSGCEHCVVENLTIQNIYVAKPGDNSGNTELRGIDSPHSNDMTIAGNLFKDMGWAILTKVEEGEGHLVIEHNRLTGLTHGWALEATNPAGARGPVTFAYNAMYEPNKGTWEESEDVNHADAIHCFDGTSPPQFEGLYIYGNDFHMEYANTTAGIFLDDSYCSSATSKTWIFNNVVTASWATGHPWNQGYVGSTGEDYVFDDTIVGRKPNEGSCATINGESASVRFENNLLATCQNFAAIEKGRLASGGLNHNLYANSEGGGNERWNTGSEAAGGGETLAKWREVTGQEGESLESNASGWTKANESSAKAKCVKEGECTTAAEWEEAGQLLAGSPAKEAGMKLTALKTLCEGIGKATTQASAAEAACTENIEGTARTEPTNIGAY